MDFFQAQAEARGRSRRLVILFGAAVIAIVAGVCLLVYVFFWWTGEPALFDRVVPGVAVGTIVLILGASSYRTHQLRKGGSAVAELLGGRRVTPDTTRPDERRLVNVVEEMALAAGTPVPAIYVLRGEDSINAFAAGYTLDDAAIAVTRGALTNLTRDELQGVIAHEFSHILHGDMQLNTRLVGQLFGILALTLLGRGLLRTGRGMSGGALRGGGRMPGLAPRADIFVAPVAAGLILIGYIGVLFGRLIQAAVSRQREYLADASAVQYTRNPAGITGALRKIGGLPGDSRIEDPGAEGVNHLFFAPGLARPFLSALATHPPLAERVRRLDPSFDGSFPRVQPGAAASASPAGASAFAGDVPYATDSRAATVPSAAGAAASADATHVAFAVGAPQPADLTAAARLLDSLPGEVRTAAQTPASAQPLLFALMLHGAAPDVAARRVLTAFGGDGLLAQVEALLHHVAALPRASHLAVVDLLLPALRPIEPARRAALHRAVGELARADGRMNMFEFAVHHIVGRQLLSENAATAARVGVHALPPLRREVETLLSAIAWTGARNATEAAEHFGAGAASLPPNIGVLALADRSALSMPGIEAALERLRSAAPGVQRRFLDAGALAAAHDGRVLPEEAHLLRAIAEAIGCPLPMASAFASSAAPPAPARA
jgi:Zn-dependent protease with chaperone function